MYDVVWEDCEGEEEPSPGVLHWRTSSLTTVLFELRQMMKTRMAVSQMRMVIKAPMKYWSFKIIKCVPSLSQPSTSRRRHTVRG